MTMKIWGISGGAAVLLAAGLLTGCGTASDDSKHQIETGVSVSGYPQGQPKDSGSPALASSTETKYSRDTEEKEEPAKTEGTSKK
jgi:hypothetical protein